ncbi:unnamed protein product, partial [Callosobruchus maculatus]
KYLRRYNKKRNKTFKNQCFGAMCLYTFVTR